MQRNGNHGSSPPHAACASCKHQRKKCDENCILHPYFPAQKSKEFQAVHRVFGVSNVVKLVRSVPVEDRQKLADSLIWEACCRQKDPVLGPFGEYAKVSDELRLYKTQILNQNHQFTAAANQQNQLVTAANQLLMPPHTPPQQGMMYKPGIAWNGSRDYSSQDNNGAVIVDPSSYSYPAFNYNNNNNHNTHNNLQGLEKFRKQEKDASSRLNTSQQSQQHHSSFNQQQYYLSGQYGSINGKKMDSTLWESGP